MKTIALTAMTKGWFIGSFNPTLLDTETVEVAVKHYAAGDFEAAHYHKLGTEFTVIISGEVTMNGERRVSGDIVVIEPDETVAFCALTPAVTVVVKIPGAKNDKYSAR